jgi:protocatechuate 3,4-dioxygenase beta subunit
MTRAQKFMPTALIAFALLVPGAGHASPGSGCPTFNPPSTLVLAAGTPQSAPLGTPFQTSFRVGLAATNGCPITTPLAGVAVTFTAPASGPSGVFSASDTNATLVGTDDSGTATAPMFTANMLPGGYLVVASSAVGSVVFSVVNTPSGVPATIRTLSPSSQSAVVGARFSKPLRVEVLDATRKPIEGANVSFSLGAGASFDGGGAQATSSTDASGIATSPSFVAGPAAGTFTAIATVMGINGQARFILDDLAAKPPHVSVAGRGSQSAVVGTRYRQPLEVTVHDAAGRPVAGATVAFSLSAGAGAGTGSIAGASFTGGAEQATATTNSKGIASSPRLTADTTAGSFAATATLTSGGTVAFSLRNRAGRPASVTAGVAASESTTVGSRFPVRFAVTVADENGNAVAGVVVTYSAPRSGASGRFAHGRHTVRVKTDARGIAVAPAFEADGTAGGYVVRASAAGHAAAFGLVNEPANG